MRIPIVVAVSMVLAGFASAPEQALGDDWITYRHDPTRSGVTEERLDWGSLGMAWQWKAATAPASAWSGPAKWDAYAGIRGLQSMRNYDPAFAVIATNDAVFFGSSADDSVRRVRLADGEVEWVFTAGGPVRIAPTFDDGRLYFGSDDGFAYCLDAQSGDLVWRVNGQPGPNGDDDREGSTARQILNNQRPITFWPIRSGVAVINGKAYFAASMLPWKKSYLHCVDAGSGQRGAAGTFVREFDGQTMEGCLALSPERVVVPQGRVAPILFDRDSGDAMGSLKGGGGCFVVVTPDGAIVHGPGNKTGWVTSSNVSSREVVATYKGGKVLCLDGIHSFLLTNDALVATDYSKKKLLWQIKQVSFHTMIVSGRAVVCGGTDRIVAYDRLTGDELWRGGVRGNVHELAVSNGRLLASDDTGGVTCFSAIGTALATAEPAIESVAPEVDVTPLKEAGLVSQWNFHPGLVAAAEVKPLVGRLAASLSGPPRFARFDNHYAIDLRGEKTGLTVRERFQDADLPATGLTVEAWVRMDEPQSWGCILGAMQDNGSHERGWLLGVTGDRFAFAVASEKEPVRMTYLASPQPFVRQQWYHVAGSYDGMHQRLYIDGQLVADSRAQTGAIAYPTRAFYKIGVYHDDDEHFPLNGMLHEVRLFDRPLAGDAISAHARSRELVNPQYSKFLTGPILRFTGPTTGEIELRTEDETKTRVWLRNRESQRVFESDAIGTLHRVSIDGLARNRLYEYQVEAEDSRGIRRSEWFECDTFFNYATPPVPESVVMACPADRRKVAQSLASLGAARAGIAVVLGDLDRDIGVGLAIESRLRTIVYHTDADRIRELRRYYMSLGLYGSRICVQQVDDTASIPLTSASANLVLAGPGELQHASEPTLKEMVRLAQPGGAIVYALAGAPAVASAKYERVLTEMGLGVEHEDPEIGFVRQVAFHGAGEWSHLYGAADNSAFNGETLAGVRSREDLAVQWIGRPGARYQPDRNGRKPSPLSAGGRLYLQGLQRVLALDVYNGSMLWSLEIPELGRFNMPRDSANWCADSEYLYVTVRDQCWQIHGATGRLERVVPVRIPELAGTEFDWGYISSGPGLVVGSATKRGAAFKSFWGGANEGWYDAKSGDATGKVCSDNLFAFNKETGEVEWEYRGGVVINSTVSANDDVIYLVESRNEAIREDAARRITDARLFEDQYLVALDRKTGKPLWEYSLSTEPGTVVYYLAAGSGKLALVASSKSQYHVYVFDADEGAANWENHFAWPSDNHGGHMSRPAIVDNTLYVRPRAFDLRDGQVLSQSLPAGGCGTYAATSNALFFRSRNVTVWNRETGNTSSWPRLRPDCWLSTIPAGGMLLSPEGGGGCSCGSWLETSIGFIPRLRLRQ